MAKGSDNNNRLYYADLGDPKRPNLAASGQAARRRRRRGVQRVRQQGVGVVRANRSRRTQPEGDRARHHEPVAVGMEDRRARGEGGHRERQPHRRSHRHAVSRRRAEPIVAVYAGRNARGGRFAAGRRDRRVDRRTRGFAGDLLPVQLAAVADDGLLIRPCVEVADAVRGARTADRREPVRNETALRHIERRYARAVSS